MDIFKQFATNPNLELDGVWHDLGPAQRMKEGTNEPDPASIPRIKVARLNNKRYGRLLVQQYEVNKTLLEMKGDAAEAKSEEITVDVMAQSILLGWENLEYDGAPLPNTWSLDNAKKLLKVKDFRDLVGQKAAERQKYLLAADEASGKN